MAHDFGRVVNPDLVGEVSPRKRSGRPVKSAMALGSSVEELVAKIVLAGATLPSFV
jgi:hypothetical protein